MKLRGIWLGIGTTRNRPPPFVGVGAALAAFTPHSVMKSK
jgi:hypothetical protein